MSLFCSHEYAATRVRRMQNLLGTTHYVVMALCRRCGKSKMMREKGLNPPWSRRHAEDVAEAIGWAGDVA